MYIYLILEKLMSIISILIEFLESLWASWAYLLNIYNFEVNKRIYYLYSLIHTLFYKTFLYILKKYFFLFYVFKNYSKYN